MVVLLFGVKMMMPALMIESSAPIMYFFLSLPLIGCSAIDIVWFGKIKPVDCSDVVLINNILHRMLWSSHLVWCTFSL